MKQSKNKSLLSKINRAILKTGFRDTVLLPDKSISNKVIGMNTYKTVFGRLLSHVKRPEFYKLCKTMNSDKYRKDFNTWDQFVAMSFAQITGQNGLRSIENAMNNQMSTFYHLGLGKEMKHSTISYAKKNYGSDFFESLYYQFFSTLERGACKVTEKTVCRRRNHDRALHE